MIPLYLGLIRPFIHNYIPGILKRMGLGMMLLLISGLCTLLMGIFGHNCSDLSKDLNECPISLITYFNISPHYLIIQSTLNAVGYMLLYIAIYEFIYMFIEPSFNERTSDWNSLCDQRNFSISGYTSGVHTCYSSMPFPAQISCLWLIFYVVSLAIALIGIIAFLCLARRYHYRQRDEPDNIYISLC